MCIRDRVRAAQSEHDVPELRTLMRKYHEAYTTQPRDRDTRILLSISNLSHLRSHVIGAWIKQFEDAYHVKLTTEQTRLLDTCTRIDNELLSDSVRRKGQCVQEIVRQGILESGIKWDQCPHCLLYTSDAADE